VAITMGVGLPATADAPTADSSQARLQSALTHARPTPNAEPASEHTARRLAELLRDHYAQVWRMLRRLGVDAACADDAAQEVFIVLSRKLADVRPGSERPFLLGSAVRVAANYRRRWRVRHEVTDEQALAKQRDPAPSAEQLLDHKRLRQALDELLEGWPDDIRTAFVLFELEGLSVPEISQLTETKTGTVASRLRRARELFQIGVKRLRARGATGRQP
jgi:RNA polymerase sigma-70 factor (ECF subfamily)